VRVIGGSSRGRRLPARLPPGVRPTSDRVREAIFDILGSMGGVEGLLVADLYCGSGALGAEALSRGAAHVTFVDQDRAALAAVRTNLAAAGLAASPSLSVPDRRTTLVRAELPGWLNRSRAFDLVLCDPPYQFSGWETLLASVSCEVGVLESSAPVPLPMGWSVTRERRYGGTLVTVVRRSSSFTDATAATRSGIVEWAPGRRPAPASTGPVIAPPPAPARS